MHGAGSVSRAPGPFRSPTLIPCVRSVDGGQGQRPSLARALIQAQRRNLWRSIRVSIPIPISISISISCNGVGWTSIGCYAAQQRQVRLSRAPFLANLFCRAHEHARLCNVDGTSLGLPGPLACCWMAEQTDHNIPRTRSNGIGRGAHRGNLSLPNLLA